MFPHRFYFRSRFIISAITWIKSKLDSILRAHHRHISIGHPYLSFIGNFISRHLIRRLLFLLFVPPVPSFPPIRRSGELFTFSIYLSFSLFCFFFRVHTYIAGGKSLLAIVSPFRLRHFCSTFPRSYCVIRQSAAIDTTDRQTHRRTLALPSQSSTAQSPGARYRGTLSRTISTRVNEARARASSRPGNMHFPANCKSVTAAYLPRAPSPPGAKSVPSVRRVVFFNVNHGDCVSV